MAAPVKKQVHPKPGPPPPPPRTLIVKEFAESRAKEIAGIHAAVSGRLTGDFGSCRRKRRRTNGHIRSRKRPRVVAEGGDPGSVEADGRRMSRRSRRRKELRRNPAMGFCLAGDGTKRLPTHIWHAKRFHMVKRWGFYLPQGLFGRGKCSRAVLKWLKNGALVHDASYYHPIRLEGPEDSLLNVLRMVSVPSPSDVSEDLFHPFSCGVTYQTVMLYQAATLGSKFIAPVMCMWRPCSIDAGRKNSEQNVPCDPTTSNSRCFDSRQLWIWIHTAAYREGFDTLKNACEKQMSDTPASIECRSLEGQIARIEIMGSKAVQILQKILHPFSESCNLSSQTPLRCCDLKAGKNPQLHKTFVLDHMKLLPPNAIVSLVVHDPRDLPRKETKSESKEDLSGDCESIQQENDLPLNCRSTKTLTEDESAIFSLWSKPESNASFLSDSKELWDCANNLPLPFEESVLCAEKHHRQLTYFYLDPTKKEAQTVNNEALSPNPKEAYSKTCPIMLIKHRDIGTLTRWSIFLPLSWVKAFWIPLVSNGSHSIGLRERRWAACSNKLPTFPFDFPDSESYSLFMTDEATKFEKEANLRPPAVRPLSIPIPPPWDSILLSINRGLCISEDPKTPSEQEFGKTTTQSHHTLTSYSGDVSAQLQEAGLPFQGYVLRTSNTLKEYFNKDSVKKLLSSLNMTIGNNGSCWNMPVLVQGDVKDLYMVRVLIHAFREGAFEEGAIVCAPVLSDISLWESSCCKPECLQISQASIKSYFTRNDSGKWELNLSEAATQQWYRWPIGFITSGFVMGSTKPVAQALCSVNMLLWLRRQQISETRKETPDIFVLMRNPRSNCYRRALVTCVLEQQGQDLEFM